MLIVICAGEASGDKLAAGLIRELRVQYPAARFIGMTGPAMLSEGCESLATIDQLSVMGFSEVLKRLPQILKLRRKLVQQVLALKPDLFIGVDAPDFMLHIEAVCKKHHIKTVHYVSPTVWAWRKGRIKFIKRAVDLMLTLFPFEAKFYHDAKIFTEMVGHPLAEELQQAPTLEAARTQLGFSSTQKLIAVLPGSRQMEVKQLAHDYFATMRKCLARDPSLHFLIPAANTRIKQQLERGLKEANLEDVTTLQVGQLPLMVAAANVALVTSGTATLEVCLLKTPMVVAYKMSWLNWQICRWFVDVAFCALPNLLATHQIVPEFLQQEVSPEALTQALFHWLDNPDAVQRYQNEALKITHQLHLNAAQRAVKAISELISA